VLLTRELIDTISTVKIISNGIAELHIKKNLPLSVAKSHKQESQ
jgi:hypothetical protein